MNFNLKLKTLALSYLINKFNGDNYHNMSKFFNVYKIWNNIRLDSVPGDYIEFGIFKGKTLSDLFGEIYDNSKETKGQVKGLIGELKPLIENIGDEIGRAHV